MNPQTQQQYQNLRRLGRITKGWGQQTKYENFHPGVDIENREGTPIPALTNGTVTGVVSGKQKENPYQGYGNQVAVKDDQGNTQYYSHIKNAFVRRGQRVHSGQPIAGMSSTGSAYNPNPNGSASHVDIRIVSAARQYLNPTNLIKKYL